MPEGLTTEERDRHVKELTSRLQKKRAASRVDLVARARALANEYDLPEPTSITWSSRQQQRWGSCTPATGAIRLTNRMSAFPLWVIDYVILHELAHLVEPNHSAAFHDLIENFPQSDKAEGFLLAVSLGHAGTLSEDG